MLEYRDFGPARVAPDSESTKTAGAFLKYALIASVCLGAGALLVDLPALLIFAALVAPLVILAVLRWPYLGLLFYLVIYFTEIAAHYPELKPLRLERLVGVATLGAMFLKQIRDAGSMYVDRSRVTIALFGLMLAGLSSVPMSYAPSHSIDGLVEFFKVLVFYMLVVGLTTTKTRFRTFSILYLVCMFYIGADGLINYFSGNYEVNYQGVARLQGSTSVGGGPNSMAATVAVSFPFFAEVVRSRLRMHWRLLALAPCVMCVVVVVLTGSRSGLIGFAAGSALVAVTAKHPVRTILILGVVSALTWTVMPSEYQARFATLENASEEGTAKSRVELWVKGMYMFADRPLTGIGLRAFPWANQVYSKTTGLDSQPFHYSHSLYVQVASNLGLPGIFAFFGFVGSYLLMARRLSGKLQRRGDMEFEVIMLKGVLLGTLALLVIGIFGHNIMRRQWYIFGALTVAAWRVYSPLLTAMVASATPQQSFVGRQRAGVGPPNPSRP